LYSRSRFDDIFDSIDSSWALGWVHSDDYASYEIGYESWLYLGEGNDSKEEIPSGDENPLTPEDPEESPDSRWEYDPKFQTVFNYRLHVKGGSSNLHSLVAFLLEINMMSKQHEITVDAVEKKRDYEGLMCMPNDCEERLQTSYHDVKFTVKTLNLSASLEFQNFIETFDFAGDLRKLDPAICGAQLVDFDQRPLIVLPQAFDETRKFGIKN
jgi:hypothetical protein